MPQLDDAADTVVTHFHLTHGQTYRVAYTLGNDDQRRMTRSIATFRGLSERRMWDGKPVSCLEFLLPHGRAVSILAHQLIEARPATLNDKGQFTLVEDDHPTVRRRAVRASATTVRRSA